MRVGIQFESDIGPSGAASHEDVLPLVKVHQPIRAYVQANERGTYRDKSKKCKKSCVLTSPGRVAKCVRQGEKYGVSVHERTSHYRQNPRRRHSEKPQCFARNGAVVGA